MIRKRVLASIAFLFAVTTFFVMPANAIESQYNQQDQQPQYTQTNQRFQDDQKSQNQSQQQRPSKDNAV